MPSVSLVWRKHIWAHSDAVMSANHEHSKGLCLQRLLYLSAICGRNINAGAAEYERLQLKVCGHAPLLAQVGQPQVVQIKLCLYRLH